MSGNPVSVGDSHPTSVKAHQSDPVIIYDDSDIRVIWRAGLSDYLLITFGDLVGLVDGVRFAADIPTQKVGITCIGFVAKRPNWYPITSIKAAYGAVIPYIDPFTCRITYGGSMGGYAAIKYSKLFGATHVISMCPQWSIDIDECDGHHPGWISYFEPRLAGMGIRTDDVAGHVTIFCDQFDRIDRFHLGRIVAAVPAALVVGVFFVGHHITHVLSGTKSLTDIIAAAIANDEKTLRLLARSARKNHNVRIEHLIEIGSQRMPRLVASLISGRLRNGALEPRLGAKYAMLAISRHLSDGEFPAAIEYYNNVKSHFPVPNQAFIMAAFLSSRIGTKLTLKTTHRTILCFSVIHGHCVHTIINARECETLLPVAFDVVGKSITLFIEFGSCRIYLHAQDDGKIGYVVDTDTIPVFHVTAASPGWFALCAEGKFLSAEREGQIVANRLEISAWERFAVGI